MDVQTLCDRLLSRFPASDAEDWDHVGLSVGRPRDEVGSVAVALDVTAGNVRRAAEQGANVLLTHHPVYLRAPDAIVPPDKAYPASAGAAYEAVDRGVSIISLHTNLDRSLDARRMLPALTELEATCSLEWPGDPDRLGCGAVAEAPEGPTLGAFARRCADAFGTEPRVWGDAGQPLHRIAFLGGSLGHMGDDVVRAGCDAVVTGEAGYHVCQDLLLRGVGVILLGHDRSEEPFVDILKAAMHAISPATRIATIDGSRQWWTLTRGDRS